MPVSIRTLIVGPIIFVVLASCQSTKPRLVESETRNPASAWTNNTIVEAYAHSGGTSIQPMVGKGHGHSCTLKLIKSERDMVVFEMTWASSPLPFEFRVYPGTAHKIADQYLLPLCDERGCENAKFWLGFDLEGRLINELGSEIGTCEFSPSAE